MANLGLITAGRYNGAQVQQVVTYPNLPPLGCAAPGGVTQIQGVSVLTIEML